MDKREKARHDVLVRLRRIEGQVRGLHRMVEEEEDCTSVITQLSAVRSALDQVGFLILSHRMEECVRRNVQNGGSDDQAIEDAMKLFLKLA